VFLLEDPIRFCSEDFLLFSDFRVRVYLWASSIRVSSVNSLERDFDFLCIFGDVLGGINKFDISEYDGGDK